jgi:cytochrome c oxidase assembly factor 6
MGAGASKEGSLPAPKISSDGAPIAPDRTQRSRCWEARDIYYTCLDKHDILDSIKEKDKAAKVCAAETRNFESNCASSWVRRCFPCYGLLEKREHPYYFAKLTLFCCKDHIF